MSNAGIVESRVVAHEGGTVRYDIRADGKIQMTIVEGIAPAMDTGTLDQLSARAKAVARAVRGRK